MTPLEDPDYSPAHPPVEGKVPEVVTRWGKRSQIRWFQRFSGELNWTQDFSQMWPTSEHHRDWCCTSCFAEYEDGYQGGGPIMDGWCCCKDQRIL